METKTSSSISGRDHAIDAARGVALFLVVLSHARHNPHYVTAFYIMAFFFLSGLLYKPGKTYGENIRKKAMRVLVPYFVNSAILLVLYAAMKSFSPEFIKKAAFGIIYSRNVVEVGTDPIMISGNAPLWYLTAFFATSLLFHLVVDKVVENWQMFMLSCVLLLTVSIVLATLPILLPWSIDMVPFFTVVMLLGYYLRKIQLRMEFNWAATLILFAGYIAICFEGGSINLSVRNYGWGGQISAIACGLTGTLACISICKKNHIKLLQWLFENIGTNSIVVLSYHLLFFLIYRSIYLRYLKPNIGESFEKFFIYDFIIVLLSVLSCITLGKMYESAKIKIHLRTKK